MQEKNIIANTYWADNERFADSEKLETDARLFFGLIQRDEDADAWTEYVEENREAFENLSSDTFEAIATFTKTGKLLENKDIYDEEGESVDMCKAMDDLMARSEKHGEKKMIRLVQCMLEDGLAEMIPRIATEPAFYQAMLKKYQIAV